MRTWITICDTCKREDWNPEAQNDTDGAILAAEIEALIPGTGLHTRRVSCMMGCKRACNIAIQGPDKLAYVLGQFAPTTADAQAIVDYAKFYDASESGQVPYRQWPDGVKGHFTSRTAPLPSDANGAE